MGISPGFLGSLGGHLEMEAKWEQGQEWGDFLGLMSWTQTPTPALPAAMREPCLLCFGFLSNVRVSPSSPCPPWEVAPSCQKPRSIPQCSAVLLQPPSCPPSPPPRPARSSVASTFNQGQPPGSREGPGWGPGRDWGLGWGQGAAPPPPRVFFLSYITSCSPSPSQRTGLMSLSGATPGKVSQPSGFPGNKSNSEKRGTAGARAKVKWGQ